MSEVLCIVSPLNATRLYHQVNTVLAYLLATILGTNQVHAWVEWKFRVM